jgi:hypothetical protein
VHNVLRGCRHSLLALLWASDAHVLSYYSIALPRQGSSLCFPSPWLELRTNTSHLTAHDAQGLGQCNARTHTTSLYTPRLSLPSFTLRAPRPTFQSLVNTHFPSKNTVLP